jgi:predicted transcriptional regulator
MRGIPVSTTSLKLTDELKQRAAEAAQSQGVTPHAFMVAAIQSATTAAERRATFLAEALDSRTAMLESGRGFDADEVHNYLRSRVAGEELPRPTAQPWRG